MQLGMATPQMRSPKGWAQLRQDSYRGRYTFGATPRHGPYRAGWSTPLVGPLSDGYTSGRISIGMDTRLVRPLPSPPSGGDALLARWIDAPLVGCLSGWVHLWYDPHKDGDRSSVIPMGTDGYTPGAIHIRMSTYLARLW